MCCPTNKVIKSDTTSFLPLGGLHEDKLCIPGTKVNGSQYCRCFQHAHFIPIVGVGKRGAHYLVHGDLPRQH